MNPVSPVPEYDVIVIGAGPAGLRAAVVLRKLGLKTAIVDEQHRPGGQIHRAVEHTPLRQCGVLGEDYFCGSALVADMRSSGACYLPSSTVVQIKRDLHVTLATPEKITQCRGRAILIATGAMERPVPFPGWTLPGVMTAGAAQIALKSSGLVADDAVFAGSGPLLYLVVTQYLRAGARVRAIIETTRRGAWRRTARHCPAALMSPASLLKGAGWFADLRRARIPVFRHVTSLEAGGSPALSTVAFCDDSGRSKTLQTEHLFVHEGVVPSISLPLSAGCAADWDTAQQSWQITTDEWGATSMPGIHVAGDCGHILGAQAAALSGEIAAIDVAFRLNRLDSQMRSEAAGPLLRRRRLHSSIRPLLDSWFIGAIASSPPAHETVACRCEAVTAGDVVAAIAECSDSIDAVKSLCRTGMGPCQGRMCSNTLRQLLDRAGTGASRLLPPRVRAPVKPIPLSRLATLAEQGRKP